jgi:phospholipase/carboxylesterase
MLEPLRIMPDVPARALCVFLHGRGQSPQDFRGLAETLAARGVAVTLPAAPGQSWYDARAVDALTDQTRGQLARALDWVGAVIDRLRAGAPGVPLLLAGFSQGACVALELAFRGTSRPDGLAALTGCRVGRPDDERPLVPLQGMPVLLTGADADPWIPVAAFAEAVADLGRAGARLRAEVFPGRSHEVIQSEILMLAEIVDDISAHRMMPGRAAP